MPIILSVCQKNTNQNHHSQRAILLNTNVEIHRTFYPNVAFQLFSLKLHFQFISLLKKKKERYEKLSHESILSMQDHGHSWLARNDNDSAWQIPLMFLVFFFTKSRSPESILDVPPLRDISCTKFLKNLSIKPIRTLWISSQKPQPQSIC